MYDAPENRGFRVGKALLLEVLPPPQVDIPVLPPQRLLDLGLLVDIEGRGLRLVQDLDLVRDDLDLAGREPRVLRSLRAGTHAAAHAEHPFVACLAQRRVSRGVVLRVRDDLRDAVAIAQVDERELAVVTPGVYPSSKRHWLTRVRGADLAAGMRRQHPLVPIVRQLRAFAGSARLVAVGARGDGVQRWRDAFRHEAGHIRDD